MAVPGSPKPTMPKQTLDAKGPKEASTPKESNTPREVRKEPEAARQEVKPIEIKKEADLNGVTGKSVEVLGDDKIRLTLERGGRGMWYGNFIFCNAVC